MCCSDYAALAKKYGLEIISSHARAKFDVKDEYVVVASGKINYQAIFNQFYKNGYQDWFVEMEAKMNVEQREQSMAMMEAMKKIQSQGGTMQDLMAEMAKNRPQEGNGDKPGQGAPPAGFGPQDPKVVAEQLKTSLEGIKESAEFHRKRKFSRYQRGV